MIPMNEKEMKLLQFIRDEIVEGLIGLKFTTASDDWIDFDFNRIKADLNTWLKNGHL